MRVGMHRRPHEEAGSDRGKPTTSSLQAARRLVVEQPSHGFCEGADSNGARDCASEKGPK